MGRSGQEKGTRKATLKLTAWCGLSIQFVYKGFDCPLWNHPSHRNSPASVFFLQMKLSDFNTSNFNTDENRISQGSLKCELNHKLLSYRDMSIPEYALSENECLGPSLPDNRENLCRLTWKGWKTRPKPNKTHTEQIAHTIKMFDWLNIDQTIPFKRITLLYIICESAWGQV